MNRFLEQLKLLLIEIAAASVLAAVIYSLAKWYAPGSLTGWRFL